MGEPKCGNCGLTTIGKDNKCVLCETIWDNSTYRPAFDVTAIYDNDGFFNRCDGAGEFNSGDVGPDKKFVIGLLNLVEGKRILDIGCGRGEICTRLANKGAEVIGIDMSSVGINDWSKKFIERDCTGATKPTFTAMKSVNVDKLNGYFDAVIFSETLEHIPFSELLVTIDKVEHKLTELGIIIIIGFDTVDEGGTEHCTTINEKTLAYLFRNFRNVVKFTFPHREGLGGCRIFMRYEDLKKYNLPFFEWRNE